MSDELEPTADWRNAETLTVEEWRQIMRISRTTAYKEIREGRVPSIKIGDAIRIPTQWIRCQLEGRAA
jgi:excisionase family DNA binding protein